MKTFISKLKNALARTAFWRKSTPAPEAEAETAESPIEASAESVPETTDAKPGMRARILGGLTFWRRWKTPPPETEAGSAEAPATPPPAEPEATAAKPRLIARILGSLAFWRRKQPSAAEAEVEEPEKSPAGKAAPPAPDGEEDETPHPFPQRFLAVLARKWVWIPAGGLALIAAGVFTTLLILRSQQAEHDRALRELQAAKAKLEQENKMLRNRPAMAPAATTAKPAPAQAVAKIDPAFDVATGNSGGANSGKGDGGDCMLSDKSNAGESLRRCIEAFNRATSGSTRKK